MTWPWRRRGNRHACPECRGAGTVTRIYSLAGPTWTRPGGTMGHHSFGWRVEPCSACLPLPATVAARDEAELPVVSATE